MGYFRKGHELETGAVLCGVTGRAGGRNKWKVDTIRFHCVQV